MKRSILFLLLLQTFLFSDPPSQRYWLKGDFLLWSIKNQPVPIPLVTAASFSDPLPGAIGQPGTEVVLGDTHIDMRWMKGFQITFGSWAIQDKYGLEADYFLLPRVVRKQSIGTSGEPGSQNLAVPIFDVTGVFGLNGVPGETIDILAGPFGADPGFQADCRLKLTSILQGAELSGIFGLVKHYDVQLEGIAGFRWLELDETFHFDVLTQSAPGYEFGFAFANLHDRFKTGNDFFSGQLGLKTRYICQKWSLCGCMKVALGGMRERLNIHGYTQTSNGNLFFETLGTSGDILPGGVFAQPTNIGNYAKWHFSALFDAGLRGGYRLGKNVEVSIGYNFLWITQVLRPGEQIDRDINTTLTGLADASRETVGTGPGPIPFGTPGKAPAPQGPSYPRVLFKNHSFWAQGLSFGIRVCL